LEFGPFENVKSQIGFCGIWCGSCTGGNGAIQELARRFEALAKKRRIERWVPKDFDFNEFMKGLASIQRMSLCPGCHKDGGYSKCRIRLCGQNRKVADCSECVELAECRNFEELEKTHPKIKDGLREIKREGRQKIIEKWTSELRGKWPHCVLLCASAEQ